MVESEYISDFTFIRDIRGDYTFSFNLTNQEIEGEPVNTDFAKYKLRIIYRKSVVPKIFIDEPRITKPKHMYSDKSLCLYHWSDFSWRNDKSIASDLIPWVYMWIYFYEIWLKTGKWYGEEYKH